MAKKVNKYDIPMYGLRKAASETRKSLPNRNCYIQISYDQDDGEILTAFHCSIGQNWWAKYRGDSIVTVCTTSGPMSMQEIADAIKFTLDYPAYPPRQFKRPAQSL